VLLCVSKNPSWTARKPPHRLLHGLPLLLVLHNHPNQPPETACLRPASTVPHLHWRLVAKKWFWEPLSGVWMPRLLLSRRRNGCGSSKCSPDLLFPRGPPPTAAGYVPAASARKVPPLTRPHSSSACSSFRARVACTEFEFGEVRCDLRRDRGGAAVASVWGRRRTQGPLFDGWTAQIDLAYPFG
jgi:hypothetical protein